MPLVIRLLMKNFNKGQNKYICNYFPFQFCFEMLLTLQYLLKADKFIQSKRRQRPAESSLSGDKPSLYLLLNLDQCYKFMSVRIKWTQLLESLRWSEMKIMVMSVKTVKLSLSWSNWRNRLYISFISNWKRIHSFMATKCISEDIPVRLCRISTFKICAL